MDKDAAESWQGICVENTVGLTLLPHPDWQTLKNNANISVYICVCTW